MVLVRYAREMGWLRVYDPLARQWHEVWAKDVPPHWRKQAYQDKADRQVRAPPPKGESEYAF